MVVFQPQAMPSEIAGYHRLPVKGRENIRRTLELCISQPSPAPCPHTHRCYFSSRAHNPFPWSLCILPLPGIPYLTQGDPSVLLLPPAKEKRKPGCNQERQLLPCFLACSLCPCLGLTHLWGSSEVPRSITRSSVPTESTPLSSGASEGAAGR